MECHSALVFYCLSPGVNPDDVRFGQLVVLVTGLTVALAVHVAALLAMSL